MMPGKFDLALYRGDSFHWKFVLWQDDQQSIPVDLTDSTVAAEIREKSAGVSIVSLGCVVTVPNIIDVTMTPEMYVTCPKIGVWDLQITSPVGDVHTVVAGAVNVTADVTDSIPMPARAKA